VAAGFALPARAGRRAHLAARDRALAGLDHLRERVPEPTDPESGVLALLEAEPAVDASPGSQPGAHAGS
jgi:hypothetical protein